MQKLVRLEEVRGYIANGWRVVVTAAAPPPDYRPGWCLVEAR
jgi:hypothetical protein